MLLKIHKSYRDVIALCDKELIGKQFEEDKFLLDIKESFYKGDEIAENEAIDLLEDYAREDATFNIVGKKSVEAAIKAGVINEESIKKVQGIPFVLILV